MDFWQLYGEAAKTAAGFFWKAGWAFILGYWVSAMIQAFVPKGRLTPYMGSGDFKSISLATIFGSASSSCSFAALAAARSLLMKGAHFIAVVAFMFASTNLVIELGILILIFLGWQFLAAELIGGLLLITISSLIIRQTYPRRWIEEAKKHTQEQDGEDEDFDWRKRLKSRQGWNMVGNKFVMDWQMVWEEILIGFTIAGFVAVFVPHWLWEGIFLKGYENVLPTWLIVVENALVAPFVAALTFIGSMGNIPLATVLNANGVLFAGIMGFIYSDLMVPPLVMINAKYYGWRTALYIAAVMFVSIVITALSLHYLFAFLGITPESAKEVGETARFSLDYTFYMNILFVILAGVLVFLHRSHQQEQEKMDHEGMDHGGMDHEMKGGMKPKRLVAFLFMAILASGFITYFINTF